VGYLYFAVIDELLGGGWAAGLGGTAELLLNAADVGVVGLDAQDAVLVDLEDEGVAGLEAHLLSNGDGDDNAAVFVEFGVEEASFGGAFHDDIYRQNDIF
jgi:hypothetical protein